MKRRAAIFLAITVSLGCGVSGVTPVSAAETFPTPPKPSNYLLFGEDTKWSDYRHLIGPNTSITVIMDDRTKKSQRRCKVHYKGTWRVEKMTDGKNGLPTCVRVRYRPWGKVT